MEISLRKAVKDDLPRIFEIEKEAFPKEEAASMEKYAWRLENYPDFLFVGQLNNQIVGAVSIIPTEMAVITDEIFEMERLPMGKNAAVLSVITSKELRKQGIAEKVLSFSLVQMRQCGMEKACLTCKEHLIHYYERFGFKKIGVSQSVHGGAVWYDMICDLA